MKKIILATMIASASAFAVHAQEQKPAEPKIAEQKTTASKEDQKAQQAKQAQEMENMIKTELKLTDEQSVKFSALAKEFNEKKDAIAKDAGLSDDAKKEKKAA